MNLKKNNIRPFAAPSKCCPVRPAPPSLRLCPRLRTSFSPSTSTPVDVVFSHCSLCRSLELHWQHALQLTSVVFRTSKTKIQCSGCQPHILLLHEKFHTTIYRVAYSNACIGSFIVCEISTAFRGVPAKINSVPAPGFPRSSHFHSPPAVFPQHLSQFPQNPRDSLHPSSRADLCLTVPQVQACLYDGAKNLEPWTTLRCRGVVQFTR